MEQTEVQPANAEKEKDEEVKDENLKEKKRDVKLAKKQEDLQAIYSFFSDKGVNFAKRDIIKDGDKVLLVENSGKMNLIKVKTSKHILLFSFSLFENSIYTIK